MTYTSCGKEVLLNGLHFADCNEPEFAILTANALNSYSATVDVPCEVCKLVGSHVPTCEVGRMQCETPNTPVKERTAS